MPETDLLLELTTLLLEAGATFSTDVKPLSPDDTLLVIDMQVRERQRLDV
jgi:hypothetical protein